MSENGVVSKPALKLAEPRVDVENPWGDDLLGRSSLVGKLTGAVDGQGQSVVVSLHGGWGSGKTLFLKRWRQDLGNRGYRAIYFNAWEDDFHGDPLVAVLGQMRAELRDRSFKGSWSRISRVVGDVVLDNVVGLAENRTGLRIGALLRRRDPGSVGRYMREQQAKTALRQGLESLSARVWEETRHPLVFVLDELDRCRPDFAVQLLERVKHVFDVPNIVFVFGVNRDELCVALRSVYGEIDADVYLRKFFDFEFQLTPVDEVEFVRSMMKRYGLNDYLASFPEENMAYSHLRHLPSVAEWAFPAVWSRFGLSLRHLETCVKLLSLVARDFPRGFGYASWLLGVLIGLKLKNPDLYRRFLRQECTGAKVVDYLEPFLAQLDGGRLSYGFDFVEKLLHLDGRSGVLDLVSSQLEAMSNGQPVGETRHLSRRVRSLDKGEAKKFLEELRREKFTGDALGRRRGIAVCDDFVDELGRLIDLHKGGLGSAIAQVSPRG